MFFLEKWTGYQRPLASLNQAPVTGMDIMHTLKLRNIYQGYFPSILFVDHRTPVFKKKDISNVH